MEEINSLKNLEVPQAVGFMEGKEGGEEGEEGGLKLCDRETLKTLKIKSDEIIFFLARILIGKVTVFAPQSIKLTQFLRVCFNVEETEDGEIDKLIKSKHKSFIWVLPEFNPNQQYNDAFPNECNRLSAYKFKFVELIKLILDELIVWKDSPIKNFSTHLFKFSVFKINNQTQDNPGYIWFVEINTKLAIKETKMIKFVGKELMDEPYVPLFSIIKTCFLMTHVNSLLTNKLYEKFIKLFKNELVNVEHLWDTNALYNCKCTEPYWYKTDKHQFDGMIAQSIKI